MKKQLKKQMRNLTKNMILTAVTVIFLMAGFFCYEDATSFPGWVRVLGIMAWGWVPLFFTVNILPTRKEKGHRATTTR